MDEKGGSDQTAGSGSRISEPLLHPHVMNFVEGKIPLKSPTPDEVPMEQSKESKVYQLLEELNQHLGKVERPLELEEQTNLNGHQH